MNCWATTIDTGETTQFTLKGRSGHATSRQIKHTDETHPDDREKAPLDCTDDLLNGLGTVDDSHRGQEGYLFIEMAHIASTRNQSDMWVTRRTSGLDRCN